jgi:dihydrofolate reductase
MSRLIMWNLLTLDGFFQGANNWELDWHRDAWGEELERFSIEQLRSADRLLFGRVTYEGMAAHWQTAQGEVAQLMNKLPKVVFSRTLKRAGWENTALVRKDAAEQVPELKRHGTGNMFVFGSANLCATLMQHDLFDEYRLAVTPTVLGAGATLFGRSLNRRKLDLLEARPLALGCVILRYRPDRGH